MVYKYSLMVNNLNNLLNYIMSSIILIMTNTSELVLSGLIYNVTNTLFEFQIQEVYLLNTNFEAEYWIEFPEYCLFVKV